MLRPVLSPKLHKLALDLYKLESDLSPNKGRLAALPVTIAVSLLHINMPVIAAIENIALTVLHTLGALFFKNCSLVFALRYLDQSINNLIRIPFLLVLQPILMIRNFYATLLDPAFLHKSFEASKKDFYDTFCTIKSQRKELYQEKKDSNASFQANFIDATFMSFQTINYAGISLNGALKDIQAVFSNKTCLSKKPIHLMSSVNKSISSLNYIVSSVASLILAPLNLAHNFITKESIYLDYY